MDGKQKMMSAFSIAVVLFVAASVVASSWTVNTPLYTYRMQQMSSKMNFSPTAVNGFVYTADQGCILNYTGEYCSAGRGVLQDTTDPEVCQYPETLGGEETCSFTICVTCIRTCATCAGETCEGGYTCELTCPDSCLTCANTWCAVTCRLPCPSTMDTCGETCNPPCPVTIENC